MASSSSASRVQRHRALLKSQGMRPVQLWANNRGQTTVSLNGPLRRAIFFGAAYDLPSRQRRVSRQSSAASAASGALSNTLSKAFAAPVGQRLPCSQLRMVSSDTSIR